MMSNSRHAQFLISAAAVGLIVGLVSVRPGAQSTTAQGDPCAAPANKIVAENCKAGNPSTEGISTAPETRRFKDFQPTSATTSGRPRVSRSAPIRRSIADIYRTGYYGGLGARIL